MSHLERVSDGPREPDSGVALITVLALVVIVFVSVLFLWSGGYFAAPQVTNMMQSSSPAAVAPAQQGMPGAPGAPGAAGAPGVAGATGATSTP